ncbi:MAG TPA: hypothetical protein VGF67_14665 [Ktedonobacteraceae bacterium]
MEAGDDAARANLRRWMLLHPDWTRARLAQATGLSKSGMDTGKKRLRSAPFHEEQVLQGHSRAPSQTSPRLDQPVVDRVVEIRDDPAEGRGRTPGPKAMLSDLKRDQALQERGLRLPKSTRTIDRIFQENGRLASRLPKRAEPIERPSPMPHWPRDFKDASTVPADPHGNKQPVVETLQIIDQGTSILVAHPVRSDFPAETVLASVAQTFPEQG